MLRALSTRSAISELAYDGQYSGGSSVASSRQHSQVQMHRRPEPEVSAAAKASSDEVARLGDAVYRRAAAAAAMSTAPAPADGSPNQWQYVPQAVWKQTAEVKKA